MFDLLYVFPYERVHECWLFWILKVPMLLSSRAKHFQPQQLGPELLQKKNPGHVPFPLFTASLTHWTFWFRGPCSVLAAKNTWSCPWCNGAVRGLQLSSSSWLEFPFLAALWATGWFMVSSCTQLKDTQLKDTKVGVKLLFSGLSFCVALGGKVHLQGAPCKLPARCIAELSLWWSNITIYW